MTTDWILMRRAAAELERALRGGRVVDAGMLDDGRVALRFGGLRSKGPATLAIDAFGAPPLVSLDDTALALAVDPGWLRTAGTTLRGMRLSAIRARHGDRVLVLTFGTSSRFGVESENRLVLELVPRYGNLVLLRDRIVVAAAKQFSPADNEARSVQVAMPYEPPPLPAARIDFDGFVAALGAAGAERARSAALGAYLPLLPRLIADSLVAQAARLRWPDSAGLAVWLRDRAVSLLSATEGEPDGLGELHVYRDAHGALVAAHVLPLAQYAALAHETAPGLLPLFLEARAAAARGRSGDASERRRAALLARIGKRLAAANEALDATESRLADAGERDRLRACGDALYTHVNDVPAGATSFVPSTNPGLEIALDPELDAGANAQRYFARYRKAADALPHLGRRRDALAARREALEVLAFETERAEPATLAELENALDEVEGRRPQRAAAPLRPRAPLRLERPSGARIYVGRSPRENVEVTFRIARPDDLWFHARGIPGAHVVLQAPPGADAGDDDLAAAADLAALHSRARTAQRVDVDYTERKYVRKQRDAGPGLVWYTNARTLVGHTGRVQAIESR